MKYKQSFGIGSTRVSLKVFISAEHRRLDTVNMDAKRYNFKISLSIADV